jgi:hypothetical protein
MSEARVFRDTLRKKWALLTNHIKKDSIVENVSALLEMEQRYFQNPGRVQGPLHESFNVSGSDAAGVGSASYNSNCGPGAGIARFKNIAMPLVARIFPELVANELAGVQPMFTPVGLAYALRYRYQSGDFAGQEAGYNTVHALYSGVEPASAAGTTGATLPSSGDFAALTEADAGKVKGGMRDPGALGSGYKPAYVTHEGETLGELRDVCGTGIPEQMRYMGLTIERQEITAKTRKLAARWTYEAQQDIANMHNVDIQEQLSDLLAYEVAAEIDAEVKNNIVELAKVGGVYQWNYGSVGNADGTADGRWEQEKFRTLYTLLVKASNDIARATRRGAGNFILCSANVCTVLEGLEQFAMSSVATNLATEVSGVAKVGTIGRFTVYRDVFAQTEYAVVGYKGSRDTDAGVIYCPYVPLMFMEAVGPDSFNPRIGVMTRYGICNNLFGAENYYRYISINLGDSPIAGYGNSGYAAPLPQGATANGVVFG